MKAIKYLFLFLFSVCSVTAQTLLIDSTASIYVEQDADVCAGEVGNIIGNFFGEGTECGQSLVSTFQLSVNVSNGWNMVSVPGLNSPDQNVNTWWTYRDQGANVFRYFSGYQSVASVTPGIGYWMKHPGARTYNTGDEWPSGGIQIVVHDPISGVSGWNLIGGYELSVSSANVTTNPPGLQSGPIFKYSSGYQVATTIDPGYGYWIKLIGAGQIIIPETMAKGKESIDYFPDNWGKIVLTDATGVNYTLYAVKDEVDLSQYELPPAPMEGMYDFRFSNGRIAEEIDKSVQIIEMSGVTYPLIVRVEGMGMRLMDETGKMVNANLKSGEEIIISDSRIQKLMVAGESMPSNYSLEQNYPNPFNPSTTIRYSIPNVIASETKQSQLVTLKVFDILGNEVVTLVNEEKPAGTYEVKFDASELSSGIYFYKLQTGSYTETKKMILMK